MISQKANTTERCWVLPCSAGGTRSHRGGIARFPRKLGPTYLLFGLRVWWKVGGMSSTESGYESFLGAMRGAEDRHAATYYCFGTDDKDKLVNPAETFNQFLKDAPKPGGKGDGKGK